MDGIWHLATYSNCMFHGGCLQVSELLLLRMGTDVCCINAADIERFERFGGTAGGTLAAPQQQQQQQQ